MIHCSFHLPICISALGGSFDLAVKVPLWPAGLSVYQVTLSMLGSDCYLSLVSGVDAVQGASRFLGVYYVTLSGIPSYTTRLYCSVSTVLG